MRYVMMIYVSEDTIMNMPNEERQSYMQGYAEFHTDVNQRGIWDGGAPLQAIANTTTVRIRDGETMITDGPFAETKEQLAGVYILHCDNLDEAIELAKRMPDAKLGAIEIRPAFEKENYE